MCLNVRLANYSPNCGPEVAPFLSELGSSPTLQWSSCSPAPLVIGLQSTDPTVDPERAPSQS